MTNRLFSSDNPYRNAGIFGILLLLILGYLGYRMVATDPQTDPGAPTTTPPVALEGEAALDAIVELNRDKLLRHDERWESPLLEGNYDEARRQLESLLSNTLQMADFSRHAYYLGLLYLYAPPPDRDLDRAVEYLQVGQQFRDDAALYLAKAYIESGRLDEARQLLERAPGLRAELPESLLRQL